MDGQGLNLLGGLAQGFALGRQQKLNREQQEEMNSLKKQAFKLQEAMQKVALIEKQNEATLLNALLPQLTGGGQAAPNQAEESRQLEVQFGPGFDGPVSPEPTPAQPKQGLTDILALGGMHPVLAAIVQKKMGLPLLDAMKYQQTERGHNWDQLKYLMQRGEITYRDIGDRFIAVDKNGQVFPEFELPKSTEYVSERRTTPGGGEQIDYRPKYGSPPGGIGIPNFRQAKPDINDLPIDEDKLPLWINPQGQSPRPGTTPSQAMSGGFSRVSTNQRSMMDSTAGAQKVLGKITNLMSEVFPKQGGVFERATGGTQRTLGAYLQTNPKAAQLNSLINGTLAPMIRAMGEKGTLAEGDVSRASNLMPKLTDSADVAWLKVNELQELFKEINSSFMSNSYDPQKGLGRKKLDRIKAAEIMAASGGDKEKARKLATQMGYEF